MCTNNLCFFKKKLNEFLLSITIVGIISGCSTTKTDPIFISPTNNQNPPENNTKYLPVPDIDVGTNSLEPLQATENTINNNEPLSNQTYPVYQTEPIERVERTSLFQKKATHSNLSVNKPAAAASKNAHISNHTNSFKKNKKKTIFLSEKKSSSLSSSTTNSYKTENKPVNSKQKERYNNKSVENKNIYTVQVGDTLEKISQKMNINVNSLKVRNNITGDAIRPGQTLVITQENSSGKAIDSSITESKGKPLKNVVSKNNINLSKNYVKNSTVPNTQQKPTLNDKIPKLTGIGKYRWPVTGTIVNSFGKNSAGQYNDGIDISVPSGTAIKAAENGVVIYVGNSLKKLGNTVLIRHADGIVTVYGHAESISVQRGQKVQRGQTIAISGMSGDAKRPQTHFEIRKNAIALNPLNFLE
ncbi:putative lipoprotein [Liberibacter crescens BT-1]|uniref:Putative lipoprotein n=1 Tax=Liberibacter crescens (strain BT-1) TaxID=1215343 RepID=L0EW89_LIBCB|nr:M23 family metallopeptidase [Liberibacter crescens]AGA65105.1 putative lipoprotein [Liberibacter crescens BT-1]